jgi:hypothetical protein
MRSCTTPSTTHTSKDGRMDDVFDTTGRPLAGWMHALFDGGPFGEDVGRCVPGPPPRDPLVVGDTTYLLRGRRLVGPGGPYRRLRATTRGRAARWV